MIAVAAVGGVSAVRLSFGGLEPAARDVGS